MNEAEKIMQKARAVSQSRLDQQYAEAIEWFLEVKDLDAQDGLVNFSNFLEAPRELRENANLSSDHMEFLILFARLGFMEVVHRAHNEEDRRRGVVK